jgi:hypothetical protein
MPTAARRVLDRLQDMQDVAWPLTNGQVPTWNATLGKFVGGSGGDLGYTHTQSQAQTVWTVQHNLGKYPSVTVVDSAGTVVEGDIHHDSLNQVTLTFSAAFSGSAYCN